MSSTINRNPNCLYPAFAAALDAVIVDMNAWCAVHWPGHKAALAEGFRTVARQQELWAQGRTKPGDIVTYKDGVEHLSDHQSCLAGDVVGLTPAGELTWDCPKLFWSYLTHVCHVHGLQRIMDYSRFQDLPHVQWPNTDHATYVKAQMWKAQQGLK